MKMRLAGVALGAVPEHCAMRDAVFRYGAHPFLKLVMLFQQFRRCIYLPWRAKHPVGVVANGAEKLGL